MSMELPRPLIDYLNAKRAYDSDALLATLTSDAVIADEGSTYIGATAIRAWNERASKAVKATYELKAVERVAESFVLTVGVAGNFPTSPVILYFYATLRGDKIAAMTIFGAEIPKAAAAYIQATNTFDSKTAVDAFVDGALVNDNKREFRGRAAIERWFESESAADRVTLSPVDVSEHCGNVTVRAEINGNYDKTGLPDPLVLTYYFSTAAEKITQLVVMLTEPAPAAP
jgi:ketosteroid isomerase-like protein